MRRFHTDFTVIVPQVAAPDARCGRCVLDAERSVGRDAPHVLRLNEGARETVCQVDDVDAAPLVGQQAAEGVVDVAHRDTHPARRAETAAAVGVGLRREFGHAVFGVYRADAECAAQDFVELLLGNLFAVTLHAARLHYDRIFELRGVTLRQIPQRIAYAQQDFGLRIGLHGRQQPVVVVQVEAA